MVIPNDDENGSQSPPPNAESYQNKGLDSIAPTEPPTHPTGLTTPSSTPANQSSLLDFWKFLDE